MKMKYFWIGTCKIQFIGTTGCEMCLTACPLLLTSKNKIRSSLPKSFLHVEVDFLRLIFFLQKLICMEENRRYKFRNFLGLCTDCVRKTWHWFFLHPINKIHSRSSWLFPYFLIEFCFSIFVWLIRKTAQIVTRRLWCFVQTFFQWYASIWGRKLEIILKIFLSMLRMWEKKSESLSKFTQIIFQKTVCVELAYFSHSLWKKIYVTA